MKLRSLFLLTLIIALGLSNGASTATLSSDGQKYASAQNVEADEWILVDPVFLDETELKNELNAWITSYSQADPRIFNVRRCDSFTPETLRTNDPEDVDQEALFFFVIHGTWAQDASEYFLEGNAFYFQMLNFVEKCAQAARKKAYLISFRWSGENNDRGRCLGGDALSKVIGFLKETYRDSEFITIAHSHGGSVVAKASNILKDEAIIDLIINFATPVRSDESYIPKAKKIINFYSTGDGIQVFGAIDDSGGFASRLISPFKLKNCRKLARNDRIITHNVRVQIAGNDPSHSNIDSIVPALFEIIQQIDFYSLYQDLDLNYDNVDAFQLAIRSRDPERRIYLTEGSEFENVLHAMKHQITQSNKAKEAFFLLHERDIHDNPGLLKKSYDRLAKAFKNKFPSRA